MREYTNIICALFFKNIPDRAVNSTETKTVLCSGRAPSKTNRVELRPSRVDLLVTAYRGTLETQRGLRRRSRSTVETESVKEKGTRAQPLFEFRKMRLQLVLKNFRPAYSSSTKCESC